MPDFHMISPIPPAHISSQGRVFRNPIDHPDPVAVYIVSLSKIICIHHIDSDAQFDVSSENFTLLVCLSPTSPVLLDRLRE